MTVWVVEIDLALQGAAEAIEKYAAGLQAHLERICPQYRPRVRSTKETCGAEFTIPVASKSDAVNKATYWLRRAVHSERTLPWTPDLVGETTARHAA
jgi:hypothetical protein